MAKAVILDVLESTIGKYVLNLDTSSLNVAVWSGKIELNALQLNADAVNKELTRKAIEAPNFAIPFRVVSGSFASVQVDVPWARITSRSVVFRAKGLNVLVEPYDHLSGEFSTELVAAETSQKRQSNKDKKQKEKRLQDLEEAEESRKRLNAVRELANVDEFDHHSSTESDVSESKKKKSSSGSFAARLARRVIENLQLEIEQVHLSLRGTGCAAGIVLDSLNLVTTDEEGNKKFVDRVSDSKDVTKSFLYKSLYINGFGIYCNNDTVRSRNSQFGVGYHAGRSYLISPFSFQAKLRQSDCVKCIGFPKYKLSSKLSSISITVTRPQIELINTVANMVLAQRNTCRPLFPEYRPIHPIQKGTAKLWWKYAVRCIGRLNRRRSWTEFFIAYQKRKKYVYLFKRYNYHKTCPWLKSLSKEEKAKLQELEMDGTISVDILMLWRNLAAVQTDIEQKRYKQKNIELGSSHNEHTSVASPNKKESQSDIYNGIDLNDEDMEALKLVSVDFSSQEVVSSDSILCDIKFTLESLKVYLVTFENSPLASLRMGTASLSMIGNADGSFEADFSMLNLAINDLTTLNSTFPSVMRSLDSSEGNDNSSDPNQAFSAFAKTNYAGDCDLKVKMVAFEIVASPLLLKEFRRFITFTDRKNTLASRNPMLQRSISGSADLFYDADDEMRQSVINMSNYFVNADTNTNPKTEKISDKLSASLADAWRSKVKDKKKWLVELDIQAPIVVIPQNCIDSTAPMLVVNLGNFKLLYGKSEPSTSVRDWFENLNSTYDIDHCSVQMSQMSLMLGTVGRQSTRKSGILNDIDSLEALIAPISFSLNVGIENDSKLDGFGRKCSFGVLPSISIKTSPTQIKTMMSIIDTWTSLLRSEDIIAGPNEASDSLVILEEEVPEHMQRSSSVENFAFLNMTNQTQNSSYETGELFHFSLCLKKLTVTISNNDGEFIESNLVSVVLSLSQRIDGISFMRLRMGWFWILDNLQLNYPRQERIIAHSNLPQTKLENVDNFTIIQLLEKEGVFDDDHNMSYELADITISKATLPEFDKRESSIFEMCGDNTTYIHAKFTSLFINWNPHVIKHLLAFKDDILNDCFAQSKTTQHPPYSHSSLKTSSRDYSLNVSKRPSTKSSSSYMCIIAEMKSLVITLNSARDDLPLFILTMTQSKLVYQKSDSDKQDLFMSFSLGDFRLETSDETQTIKDYQSILGLAPNQSSSLLEIEYGERECLDAIGVLNEVNRESCQAYARIILSPMKFVYLHAQVLTLVEYCTEGVLGALTAQVASSAAAAAMELAQTDDGEKVFDIRATGFNFILPVSAHSSEYLALNSGNMIILYKSFSNPGEGEANLQLENFTMKCNQNTNLINSPVSMFIGVSLAPHNGPTAEDRSMRVEIHIDCAEFMLCKRHYDQIMKTLHYNIGEKNSYLRNNNSIQEFGDKLQMPKNSSQSHSQDEFLSQSLTHGGVRYYEVEKRMYIDFRVKTLSVELVGDDVNDSILCLTAVETHVSMKMITDEDKICYAVTMLNLECEDRRVQSQESNFGKIFSQSTLSNDSNQSEKDVFKLSYSKLNDDTKKDIDIKIGSPQIVLVPDLLSRVWNFIDFQKALDVGKSLEYIGDQARQNNDSFEQSDDRTCDSTLNIETLDCRLVLVDIVGADDYGSSLFQVRSDDTSDAFVLKGKGTINMSSKSNIATEKKLKTNMDINGQRIEMYTARSHSLDSPIQILEPTHISGSASWNFDGDKQISEIRLVAMSNLDFSISIQDLSFLLSIYSNLSNSFSSENELETYTESVNQLDEADISQLEKLSLALDKKNNLDHNSSHSSISLQPDPAIASNSEVNVNISTEVVSSTTIKLTIPEAEFTIINDLQGMDEALFKVLLSNFVSNTDLQKVLIHTSNVEAESKMSSSTLLFNFFFNTNILADYFNANTKSWEHFLVQPWEITFKGDRRSKNNKSGRFSTAFDIESFPCYISFSEQFLINAGAATRMWSTYSKTTEEALSIGLGNMSQTDVRKKSPQLTSSIKNRAARAVRSLKTTMPYAIDNESGLTIFLELENGNGNMIPSQIECAASSKHFFNFEPPSAKGIGAKRLYGQDIKHLKAINLLIGNSKIHFPHLDEEINRPRRVHELDNGSHVFTDVCRKGKTTILRLSSHVMIFNQTKLPFEVYLKDGSDVNKVGICHAKGGISGQSSFPLAVPGEMEHGDTEVMSSEVPKIGIPVDMLKEPFQEYPFKKSTKKITLILKSPNSADLLCGSIPIPPYQKLLQIAKQFQRSYTFEVTFSNVNPDDYRRNPTRLVAQVYCAVNIVENHPFIEFFFRPRAALQNLLHVNLLLKTPMPHTISNTTASSKETHEQNEVTHVLEPFGEVEVFTPGVSVAFAFKCADMASGGLKTGWNDAGWIDIPIGGNRFIEFPLRCVFPFVQNNNNDVFRSGGSEFFIVDSLSLGTSSSKSEKDTPNSSAQNDEISGSNQSSFSLSSQKDDARKIYITVKSIGVDHTGDALFEQATNLPIEDYSESDSISFHFPFSIFCSSIRKRRLSLLPGSSVPIRLLQSSINGIRPSAPFKSEDVPLSEGGMESSAILWQNDSPSGYFLYRRLSVDNQFEIHVIPEFVVYNGSGELIIVKQHGSFEFPLKAEKIAQVYRDGQKKSIPLSFEFVNLSAATAFIEVDTLGLKVGVVRSSMTGNPIGSVAIQTIIGSKDSRFVIKLGKLKFGSNYMNKNNDENLSMFADDFFRFRIRWSVLDIILNDTQRLIRKVQNNKNDEKTESIDLFEEVDTKVARIVFDRFTVDFQRIFKNDKENSVQTAKKIITSPERSQLSIVIKNIAVLDCSSDKKSVNVLRYSSTDTSFFDLCIRTRGSEGSGLVRVDLLDLNLAYCNGKSDKIIINGTEEFLWYILDIASRIVAATSELAGSQTEFKWTDDQDGYFLRVIERSKAETDTLDEDGAYCPPKSDTLYDIRLARVSPVSLLVSFKRQPLSSRYREVQNIHTAKMVNYFLTRLRFTIDKADLRFEGYVVKNIKGPSDRLVEIIKTVYMSRMKFKLIEILKATSFNDWKSLSGRDNGMEEQIEGDLLRVSGNLAGRSAGFVLKRLGQGLGGGVTLAASGFGDEIQRKSEIVGAGAVGATVNSLVTGLGGGVGNTVQGVGTGSGKLLRGGAQGIGQIVGGVGGGLILASKGIGKSFQTGDGEALKTGLSEGAAMAGDGIGRGAGTFVSGAADGVVTVGKGLFSGVKSIGKGLTGSFTGEKKEKRLNDKYILKN